MLHLDQAACKNVDPQVYFTSILLKLLKGWSFFIK